MRTFFQTAALMAVAVFTASAEEQEKKQNQRIRAERKDNGPLILTDDSYDFEQYHHKTMLINFWKEDCDRCKEINGVFTAAAQTIRDQGLPFEIGLVNEDENPSLKKRFPKDSEPKVYWSSSDTHPGTGMRNQKGEPIRVMDDESVDTILEFVNEKVSRNYEDVTCEQVKSHDFGHGLVFFGHQHSDNYRHFIAMTGKPQAIDYFHAPADCADVAGVEVEGFALHQDYAKSWLPYDKPLEIKDMFEWIVKKKTPDLITDMDKWFDMAFDEGLSSIVLFTKDDDAEYTKLFEEASHNSELRDKVMFIRPDLANEKIFPIAKTIGITAKDLPIMFAIQSQKMDFYKTDFDIKQMDMENLTDFITKFKTGRGNRHFRTKAVPEEQNNAAIEVVGTTFTEIVKDPTKDVLLCMWRMDKPDSVKFVEDFMTFANMDFGDDLVYATFDHYYNDELSLNKKKHEFPSVYYYPKDSKDEPQTIDVRSGLKGLVQWGSKYMKEQMAALKAQALSGKVDATKSEGHDEL